MYLTFNPHFHNKQTSNFTVLIFEWEQKPYNITPSMMMIMSENWTIFKINNKKQVDDLF